MEPYGADIALPDLPVALASSKRREDFSQPCGVRVMDLAARR